MDDDFVKLVIDSVKGLDKDIDDLEKKFEKGLDDAWGKIDLHHAEYASLRQEFNDFKLDVEKARNKNSDELKAAVETRCGEIKESIDKLKDKIGKIDTREQLSTNELTLKSSMKYILVMAVASLMTGIGAYIMKSLWK